MHTQLKIWLVLLFLLCNLVILGCTYTYEKVRIKQHFYSASGLASEQETKQQKKVVQRVYRTLAFAKMQSRAPAAVVNNRGVMCALEGRFIEAEILFKESLKEDLECAAAMNNLGVMYNIVGKRKAAFEWLAKACLIEPENDQFRNNFLAASETVAK